MASSTHQLLSAGAQITRAQRVLLVNPAGGDGDSFGSTLALANHRANMRAQYAVVALNPTSRTYRFLPRYEEVHPDPARLNLDSYDCICTFDFSDIELSGFADALLLRQDRLLNFDHHPTNTGFGRMNIVDPRCAATSEIVHQLFLANRWRVDSAIATCLLAGIVSDTGVFAFRNTTASTVAAAAALLRSGARLHTIHDYTYRNKTVNALRLWGVALDRLSRITDDVVATYVTQQDFADYGVGEDAVEGVANFLNALDDAKAILLLRELPDGKVKGSIRTMRDDVDVAKMAQSVGGGGHRRAAGFVSEKSIQELIASGSPLLRVLE